MAGCIAKQTIAGHVANHLGTRMFDSAAARRMMVDCQIRTADVTNPDLITAMLAVPRELFVPPALADQAYYDGDIPLGDGRVLIKPMVLAKLVQAAQVEASDHVLDVGCGAGRAPKMTSMTNASIWRQPAKLFSRAGNDSLMLA